MRVPESSKINLILTGLNKSASKSQSITEKIASGKKINRPSDDPAGSALSESYKSKIIKDETALRNSNIDRLWLDTVDSSTARMVEILRYSKAKVLEAANSYHSKESWETIATEIEALQQELTDLGNSKINDVYIYSGTKTFTQPLKSGWPYQLPGVQEVTGLFRSNNVIDDHSISNFALTDDEEENKKPITIDFSSFWNNQEVDNNNESNLESTNSVNSNNPYLLTNPDDSSFPYKVELTRNDTLDVIVDKLNDAMASKYGHTMDQSFPTGYKQDAHFFKGPDNKLYVQSLPDVNINFAKSYTKLIPMEIAPSSDAIILNDGEQSKGYFGEYVSGFSDKEILIRITSGGTIGEALYSVSDDNGANWSVNRQLKWDNELYNADGLSSTQMTLNFTKTDLPILLPEGLVFNIKPNPSIIYQGNNQERKVPLDGLNKSIINITADQLFFKHDQHSTNIFDVLERLKSNIRKGLIDEIAKEVTPVDIAIDQVLQLRSKSGITTLDIDEAENRITQSNFDSIKALSELEDADLAKAATDLSVNSVQRQAMMETSARILQPSLVQFLR